MTAARDVLGDLETLLEKDVLHKMHDAHCNVSHYAAIGEPGCSCFAPKALRLLRVIRSKYALVRKEPLFTDPAKLSEQVRKLTERKDG